jgi:hypothetical protein
MKGIVFTELLEMVENRFSIETGEHLLEMSDLPSKGIYTSVGTYDYREIITLVSNLSNITEVPAPLLLKEFGRHMFRVFVDRFPIFFQGINSAFEFLPRVHNYVHLEVQKLYSDAELPTFSTNSPSPGILLMKYQSVRNFPDFAEGLIQGCLEYFKEDCEVTNGLTIV